MILIIAIIALIINVALIWSIFNIRNNIEEQRSMSITMVNLLAKIAKNTGSLPDDVEETLSKLKKSIGK